jgi:asparagine synthase (glutamine-hydrolysing)
MFALAIWDLRSRRLILARDRIGKKPLYYAATAEAFLFGSEIKALLTWPGVRRAPDLAVIDRYLTWGYVPAPHTAFVGVSKLPLHIIFSSSRVWVAACRSRSSSAIGVCPRRAPSGGLNV